MIVALQAFEYSAERLEQAHALLNGVRQKQHSIRNRISKGDSLVGYVEGELEAELASYEAAGRHLTTFIQAATAYQVELLNKRAVQACREVGQ